MVCDQRADLGQVGFGEQGGSRQIALGRRRVAVPIALTTLLQGAPSAATEAQIRTAYPIAHVVARAGTRLCVVADFVVLEARLLEGFFDGQKGIRDGGFVQERQLAFAGERTE